MNNVLRFEDKEVVVRAAQESDAEIVMQWWSDGKVMAHAGFPEGIKTPKEKVINNIKDTNKRQLFIIESDGMKIGECHYGEISDKVAKMGIKICDFSMHNKGIGTRVCKLLIHYLFAALDYEKIALDPRKDNVPAVRLYQKLGFKCVSEYEDDFFKTTVCDLELLKDDYIKTKDNDFA